MLRTLLVVIILGGLMRLIELRFYSGHHAPAWLTLTVVMAILGGVAWLKIRKSDEV